MKRRNFIKKAALGTAAAYTVPYLLPSGRLFAASGSRIANHVVFVVFGGGIRNQESVQQLYVSTQNGQSATGNVMPNMLSGADPSGSLLYTPLNKRLGKSLQEDGTLFSELRYTTGPTGHYNGHTVAITGQYTETGLNLNVNPEHPTVFEYYRKHNTPEMSALNAWWISNSLGPYPSLNFSRHQDYGPLYGANFISPPTTFGGNAYANLHTTLGFDPDERNKVGALKGFLDNNFERSAESLMSIMHSEQDRELYKAFINSTIDKAANGQIASPVPAGQLNGDLLNAVYALEVMKAFQPELMVINMTASDVCHSNFTNYIQNLHRADHAVAYLWEELQKIPGMANDTVFIAMPEHGRNLMPNTLADQNGLLAFDHTSDQNSREIFALMAGKGIKANQNIGMVGGSPVGESIDVVPTIAKILGFYDDIPAGMLPGSPLNQAFL